MVYESEIEDAYADIAEAGEPNIITRSNNTPSDTSEPWNDEASSPSDTNTPCAVLWLGAAKAGGASTNMDGSLVTSQRRKILIAGKGVSFTPEPQDYITRASGEVWAIESITPLDLNGEVILYKGVAAR